LKSKPNILVVKFPLEEVVEATCVCSSLNPSAFVLYQRIGHCVRETQPRNKGREKEPREREREREQRESRERERREIIERLNFGDLHAHLNRALVPFLTLHGLEFGATIQTVELLSAFICQVRLQVLHVLERAGTIIAFVPGGNWGRFFHANTIPAHEMS